MTPAMLGCLTNTLASRQHARLQLALLFGCACTRKAVHVQELSDVYDLEVQS